MLVKDLKKMLEGLPDDALVLSSGHRGSFMIADAIPIRVECIGPQLRSDPSYHYVLNPNSPDQAIFIENRPGDYLRRTPWRN